MLLLPLAWFLSAELLPMTQDEAYYVAWTRAPDWGYFDHPPFVMAMAWPVTLIPDSPTLARLGVFVLAFATLWLALRMYRRYLPQVADTAALLLGGSLVLLLLGVLVTPDTPLIFCWTLALHEAAAALTGSPKRWLTAGVATGLGILAKFTMLLIGPVFLWALIVETRRGGRGLRSPWPYLGGVMAVVVLLPHLYWNTQHDWITWRFQLRHGLGEPRAEMARAGDLPAASKARYVNTEMVLAAPFLALKEVTEEEDKAPAAYDELLAALNRYVGFYGSQIGAWGALVPLVGLMWWRRRSRHPERSEGSPAEEILRYAQDDSRTLFLAATAVPLGLFGVMALFTKVEANWSGMYVIGAAPLLAPWVDRLLGGKHKPLLFVVTLNAVLLVAAAAHARSPYLATRPHRDRILKETHGYAALADVIRPMTEPVFADSYQLTAQLRFHLGRLDVRQWPGVTRDSEFVRRTAWQDLPYDQLRRHGRLNLVTTDLPPPVLPGFSAVGIKQLRDCKGMELQVLDAEAAELAASSPASRCKKPVHEWYLVSYHAR